MGTELPFDDCRQELSLVRRMSKGERSAFDTFVTQYTPGLIRYAQTHLPGDVEAVADTVQTTLTIAIEKLETFRGDGALGAWLVSICRFQIGTYRRRQRVRDRWSAGAGIDLETVEAPEDLHSASLERRELTAQIHSTLELLNPPYGQVLEWRYLEELPVKTIAQRLELSVKAAESLLTRARATFRRLFDGPVGISGDR